jgi:radical SAM protein with 4Fe4S-binding SPASM domain
MDTTSLVLQGAGEPMLHPEFIDIIQWTKSTGFHITLLTNGTLLNQITVNSIIKAKLDVLKVSLWATNTEQYRKNYPGPNTENFYRVIEGLTEVSNQKKASGSCHPELVLYYVINHYNYQTIDEIVDLACKVGCNQLYFGIMHNFRDGLNEAILNTEEKDEVSATLEKTKPQLHSLSMGHNIDTLLLRLKTGTKVWKDYPCYVPWFHARIRADGMVQPCGRCDNTINFGDLHKQSFGEIWNGKEIRAFRKQVSSPKGLKEMTSHCDCRYCSFLGDIERVHRVYKWFQPLSLANLWK